MIKAYKATKYPSLYKGVYWGNHEIADNERTQALVLARNEFVEEFKIVKADHSSHLGKNYVIGALAAPIDHIEAYRGNNGEYVLVVSSYESEGIEIINEPWSSFNWEANERMYAPNARTFVCFFDGFRDLRDSVYASVRKRTYRAKDPQLDKAILKVSYNNALGAVQPMKECIEPHFLKY